MQLLRIYSSTTEYGLGAFAWRKDPEALRAVVQQGDPGTVSKATRCWIPSVLYEGHKHFGVAGEFGREGLEQYCNIQIIARNQ